MLELLDRRRQEALTELHALEATRRELKGQLGTNGARLHDLHTRLALIDELRAELATGADTNKDPSTEPANGEEQERHHERPIEE